MAFTCSLKQKMLFPLLASVIVSGLIGAPLISQRLNALKSTLLTDLVVAKKATIERAVERAGKDAMEKAALFTQLPMVRQAYELAHSGNIDDEADPMGQEAREMLRRELGPQMAGYASVSNDDKLKLHFHLPNGRSLVRMWLKQQVERDGTPLDVSDDISGFRKTVLDVNKTGQPLQGIELGKGGFELRGMAPVKAEDGRQLGSAEILVSFDAIFKGAQGKGENLLLYMNADLLKISSKLRDPAKYPVLDNKFVLVTGTKEGLVEKRVDASFLEQGAKDVTMVETDGSALAAFPVNDYEGKQIGIMVLSMDTTQITAGIRSVLLVFAGTGLLILVLIVAVNYTALVKAVIRPVDRISQTLNATAVQVSDASQQITSGSQVLAEGASEAAASIEETSASLEEISSM
ncbi:MAG: methyl-accepting chemotaxis protein, partial [Desulfobulbaceae bacterium]|nr:methyl-accepting chemotaxis protein [Desulfobulbaceae bacterium]